MRWATSITRRSAAEPATAHAVGLPMQVRQRRRWCRRSGMPGCITRRTPRWLSGRASPGRNLICRTRQARRQATARRDTIIAVAPGPAPPATTKPGPLGTEVRRMHRRSIVEVIIGAVVLLVAAGFLAYAVANSGRSATSGYTLYAKFDHID